MKPATLLLAAALALPAAAETEPVLRPVDHGEWLQALSGYRGNLVVVDFWATWCLPCIERFPKMVELSRRYADRGVTFVAFSLDDRGDSGAMAMAESFVVEQGGLIDHYVTTEPIPDAFAHLGLLGIPAVKIYARDGTLERTLDSDDPNAQFTDEDVEEAVVELLGG